MKTMEIINKISIYHSEKWDFITKMLSREKIEEIAQGFSGEENNATMEELGLEKEDTDIASDCMNLLMRFASKEMWRGISKEQVNDLLKPMYALNVQSVKMQNLRDYSTKEIIDSWENANL